MHAIILAGGEGTRLRPLTIDRPKPMVEIDGTPIIEHQIRQLLKAGIKDITILENYLPQKIQEYLGDGSKFGVNITHLELPKELQSSGAIKKAIESTIPESESNFLVLYGDIISNVDLKGLAEQHTSQEALITAVTIPVKFPYGVWQEDDMGRVNSFKEKPFIDTNSGLFAANRGILDFLREGKDFFGGTIVPIIELGRNGRGTSLIKTFPHSPEGFWRDIADTKNLEEAEAHKSEWELNPSALEGMHAHSHETEH